MKKSWLISVPIFKSRIQLLTNWFNSNFTDLSLKIDLHKYFHWHHIRSIIVIHSKPIPVSRQSKIVESKQRGQLNFVTFVSSLGKSGFYVQVQAFKFFNKFFNTFVSGIYSVKCQIINPYSSIQKVGKRELS